MGILLLQKPGKLDRAMKEMQEMRHTRTHSPANWQSRALSAPFARKSLIFLWADISRLALQPFIHAGLANTPVEPDSWENRDIGGWPRP